MYTHRAVQTEEGYDIFDIETNELTHKMRRKSTGLALWELINTESSEREDLDRYRNDIFERHDIEVRFSS